MEAPELDARLEKKLSNLQNFRRNQEAIWGTVGTAYFVSQMLIQSVTVLQDLTLQEAHRSMMWRTALDYQMESFFLLIDTRLDEGLAVLRMTSELTRDIARIGNDAARLHCWQNRLDPNNLRQYRQDFKFDDTNKFERFIHDLYRLSSSFGVHGHRSRTAALRPTGEIVEGKYVVLDVPDTEVFKGLEIWLAAFYPVHQICAQTFFPLRSEQLVECHSHFLSLWEAFDGVFAVYRDNLRKLDADVLFNSSLEPVIRHPTS
ncbi:MAG: hypothetical protein ACREEM_13500 [Blastocatellia bacterium]